jgi:hypothetical protein
MQILVNFIHAACDWRSRCYNLLATGGHSAASCMQNLYAPAASCVHSRRFFASTLREQLFELKNEDAIKNLRIYVTHVLAKAYPLTLCMA